MNFAKGRFTFGLGVVVLSLFQPASGWGSTIRDDQPDSGYINLATSAAYASVGLFVNSWGYTGSGTLIAPDWVLTAAHSVTAASSGTFTINGSDYTSTALFRNPGWTGDGFGGYDFGLVHLSSPVFGVTPATLYTGSAEFGQIGTFVGFGFTGTGLTGWKPVGNQKRAFQSVIDGGFGNTDILLGADFDNPHTTADNAFGEATPLPLEGAVAPGDSGGGVFITIGAQTYLAGVISFIAATDGSANSDYGDVDGFGRVTAVEPWIASLVPELVPEPSGSWLLAGPGLVLLGRRWWQTKK